MGGKIAAERASGLTRAVTERRLANIMATAPDFAAVTVPRGMAARPVSANRHLALFESLG